MNKKNYVEFMQWYKFEYDCDPTPLDIWNYATQFMEYVLFKQKSYTIRDVQLIDKHLNEYSDDNKEVMEAWKSIKQSLS